MADVETVTPDYSTGEQIDLDVADGGIKGTYSTVLKSIGNGRLHLEVPEVNGLYLPLSTGDRLVLKQYDQGATFEAETEILERDDGGDTPVVAVQLPKQVKRIQRRNFVRVPCDIPAEVLIMESGDEDKSLPSSMEGTIEDISAGGVQLALDKKLPMFTEIELTFRLPVIESELDEVFGEIIRVPDSSDPPFPLGVEFTSITENKRNDIIQYVYERQMDLQN